MPDRPELADSEDQPHQPLVAAAAAHRRDRRAKRRGKFPTRSGVVMMRVRGRTATEPRKLEIVAKFGDKTVRLHAV